jgi:uncharacterized protein with FMN-binding domain
MKTFFATNKLKLIISAILVAIFVLGGFYSGYMTKQITFHQYADLFPNATSIEAFVPEAIDEDVFVGAYQAFEQKTLIGVVYIVLAAGRVGNLQIAYGIDVLTHQTTGVKVLEQSETPEYYNRIGSAFFNQFKDYSLDQLNMQIATVAGATVSSTAFQTGLVSAREQYARDFDFVIPNAILLINSVEYNTDFATLIAKPILANITNLLTNETMVVSLTALFDFVAVETVGATVPAAEVLSELKATAQRDYINYSKTYATSYDANLRSLVIKSRGYDGSGIFVTLTLNEALDAVVSYTVVSAESYDQSHDYDQAYGAAPGIENRLMNQYLADAPFAAIAGATITSNAMQRLFVYLDQLLDGNGGN